MTPRYLPITLGCLALLNILAWPVLSAAQTQAAPSPLAFKSAFENYQPYTDDKTGNWKQANDTTARIGGWRAYAKEAAGSEPVKTAPPNAPPVPSSDAVPKPVAAKP